MDLIPSISISALLIQREGFRRRMLAAEVLEKEAEEIFIASKIGLEERDWTNTHSQKDFICLGTHHFDTPHRYTFPTTENMLKGFDALAWKMLMRESGMLTFMSSKARDKWSEDIREKRTPELTLENIQSTFTTLQASRGDLMERGVVELFRSLSWSHKTNQPVKFGKKLILVRFETRCAPHIDDLLRVLHIFDGKPQPDVRENFSSKFSDYYGLRGFESEYADFQFFQNGNLHVKITRPDMIDKLNAVLAKSFPDALPAPR